MSSATCCVYVPDINGIVGLDDAFMPPDVGSCMVLWIALFVLAIGMDFFLLVFLS